MVKRESSSLRALVIKGTKRENQSKQTRFQFLLPPKELFAGFRSWDMTSKRERERAC